MTTMTLAKALNAGLRRALEADPKVLLMGEDIGRLGGVFRITEGLQADFGVDRVLDSRRDDLEPGSVREVGLRRLGVVLDRADAAAVGDADHERHGEPSVRPEPQPGHLRDELVERREHESVGRPRPTPTG